MKLGLESFSLRHSGLDPIGVLQLAHELGVGGVLFEMSAFTSFSDAALQSIREYAEERELYIELGMGSIFAWHPMAEKGRRLLQDAGYDMTVSDAGVVIHHLRVAKVLGSSLLRCVAGSLLTRDEGHDMRALADDAVAILAEASRAAGDMGMKLALENHADFTVREHVGILARVDHPALGFTLDSANLAFDLDEPERLAALMAPYTFTTHFKNYRIGRTRKGLTLENCALGDGDIDVRAIADLIFKQRPEVNLNIEIHSQFPPFTLDVLDTNFFHRRPLPPSDGLTWYFARSWQRSITEALPAGLPDGLQSWECEYEHLKQSISWAQKNLSQLLSA